MIIDGQLYTDSIFGRRIIETYRREFRNQFEPLGRTEYAEVETQLDSWGGEIEREFNYTYNDATGSMTRTGPDGVNTVITRDAAGRVATVTRGDTGSAVVQAVYAYRGDGLLAFVTDNGLRRTEYSYDGAKRVTSIDHRRFVGVQYETMLKLVYVYQKNDLVAQIYEYDESGLTGIVTFGYDTRGRLISEDRLGQIPYSLEYQYDQGGNRTLKIRRLDGIHFIEVRYTYDISDPLHYGSNNNRLMQTETFDVTFGSGSAGDPSRFEVGETSVPVETLLETTWYYYNGSGNVTDVQTQFENPPVGSPSDSVTLLHYARNGESLTFVYGLTTRDGIIQNEYAREFRYDSARARYLDREVGGLASGNYVVLSDRWSDYDGDQIYGDYSVTQGLPDFPGGPLPPPNARNLRSYQSGIAKFSWMDDGAGQMVPDPGSVAYYHSDMIGTTRLMTDATINAMGDVTYTAFGEVISGTSDRFGYAGAWGYQAPSSDDPNDPYNDFPFLHVGARYYDPALGRFLQRDPIGILGGFNVYAYVANNPVIWIDPSGLGPVDWIKNAAKAIWEAIKTVVSPVDPTEQAAGAADCMMSDALRRHVLKDHDDGIPDPKNCPACKKLTPKPPKKAPPPPGKGSPPAG